jgi:hypothetical protein
MKSFAECNGYARVEAATKSKGAQRTQSFAECNGYVQVEAATKSKGVQRTQSFAGVWGVPNFPIYPAAAGGKSSI